MIQKVEGEIVAESVVGEEHSLEVVVLVEEEASGEAGQVFGKGYAVLVDGGNFDLFGAVDGAVEPGNREAAFKSGALWRTTESHFFALIYYDWVEIYFDTLFEIGDETADVVADLGEAEANALGVVGGFHCVN